MIELESDLLAARREKDELEADITSLVGELHAASDKLIDGFPATPPSAAKH